MEFTAEEREKLKKVMMFLVRRRHNDSGGHCGFHPVDFLKTMGGLMEDLTAEGQVDERDSLHTKRYFLAKNKSNE